MVKEKENNQQIKQEVERIEIFIKWLVFILVLIMFSLVVYNLIQGYYSGIERCILLNETGWCRK